MTTPEEFIALDTLSHQVIADAEINGVPIKIDQYKWLITHKNGDTIEIIEEGNNSITWLPQNSGYFQVVVVLSIGNKSIRQIEQIYIDPNSVRIWNYIIGTWKVYGNIGDDY